MNKCLKTRGPDNSVVVSISEITLGHTLLNIRSTTAKAKQPLSWQNYTLVFNGEIYNLEELKSKLRGTYAFSSESDGEILLYLFYEYGVESFKYLNGEFAFVLWDDKQKLLYAVVDHLAIKQLYYSVTDTGVVLSSEINSLMTVPHLKTSLNYQSMYDALTVGCCLGAQTMYTHISFIEGGTYVVVKNKSPRVHSYYQLPAHTERVSDSAFISKAEEVQAILDTAIQQRTVGKYGLASSLSGGTDSSLISIIAHKFRPDTLMLSGHFPASTYPLQDAQFQYIVAKMFKLPQKFFTESKLTKQKIQLFLKLQDDIAYHPSHYGRIDLARCCVKEKKRVLLVGDGADELFLGYSLYPTLLQLSQGRLSIKDIQDKQLLKIIRQNLPLGAGTFFSQHFRYTDQEKQALLPADFQSVLQYQTQVLITDALRKQYPCSEDVLNVFAYAELKFKMRQVITFYDRLASHFSLELRFPFLDRKLIEVVLPLPSNIKLYRGDAKALLKKIFLNYVPRHIAYAKKSGMLGTAPRPADWNFLLKG